MVGFGLGFGFGFGLALESGPGHVCDDLVRDDVPALWVGPEKGVQAVLPPPNVSAIAVDVYDLG